MFFYFRDAWFLKWKLLRKFFRGENNCEERKIFWLGSRKTNDSGNWGEVEEEVFSPWDVVFLVQFYGFFEVHKYTHSLAKNILISSLNTCLGKRMYEISYNRSKFPETLDREPATDTWPTWTSRRRRPPFRNRRNKKEEKSKLDYNFFWRGKGKGSLFSSNLSGKE